MRRKNAPASTPPTDLLTTQAILGLIGALTLAIAPHFSTLPLWLGGLFACVVSWRGWIVIRRLSLPPRALLLIVTGIASMGVFAEYRTLLGRNAGVALLAAMAACKLLETRDIRDGVVLVFLGYLLVMSHLLYSQDLLMVLYLLVAIIAILAVQMMIHPQHRSIAGRTPLWSAGKMLLYAAPVMLVLFVLFPRIPGPLWGLPKDAYGAQMGLSDEMAPGTISDLTSSDAVAFRVRFRDHIPPPQQRYWRGPVLSHFDGQRWRRVEESMYKDVVPFDLHGDPILYTVMMEPNNQRWLLVLDLPARLPSQTGMTASFQVLRDQPIREIYRYEMISYLTYQTRVLTQSDRRQNLLLPRHSGLRARTLATEWRASTQQPQALVEAALTFFRSEPFFYTLSPPLLRNDPVDEFLFETRKGFCEHYASAFVFLMRAAGVPARVVTGYQGGEYNTLGAYLIVRQADAHAWAEVWLEGQGWVRVDPTAAVAPSRIQEGLHAATNPQDVPFFMRRDSQGTSLRYGLLQWDVINNGWNEWVLAYGPDRQKAFLSELGLGLVDWRDMTIAMVLLLSALGAIYGGLRWRQRVVPSPITQAWMRCCARLSRCGLVRHADEGPLAFAERVARRRPDLARAVSTISHVYATARYGPEISATTVRHLQRLVARFRPKKYPPP